MSFLQIQENCASASPIENPHPPNNASDKSDTSRRELPPDTRRRKSEIYRRAKEEHNVSQFRPTSARRRGQFYLGDVARFLTHLSKRFEFEVRYLLDL